MTLDMHDERLVTLSQLEAFTNAANGMRFVGRTRSARYAWIERLLARFFYFTLRKRDKATVRKYIMKLTGYSDAQLTRLIRKKKKTRQIVPASREGCSSFPTTYTTDDIGLIATTDNAHGRLSGPATKKLFERAFRVFSKPEFVRLKNISVAHLYRLRGRRQYVRLAATFTKTNPTTVPIGERRKPDPEGKPGHLRVDSVHQGDREGEKGVYHVNLVDEVTQWEIVVGVEGISEAFLLPALEEALRSFPFQILGFHSDNGSEFINRVVATLLEKMRIEQTKSRSRRSNDNALVEGKNGAIVRKHMGYIHIPRKHAEKINAFYQDYFNPYLNFHRPSGYARTIVNPKGKEKKIYDHYETPYAYFRSLPKAESFLREGVTMEELEKASLLQSDNEAAILMQKAKETLFKSFRG